MSLDDKPNAPMTPREYVETIVLPTLDELVDAPADRRRAYLACLVVCHCADSLGLAEAARTPGFAKLSGRPRKDMAETATKVVQAEALRRCGSIFTVVQGIANGTKHPSRPNLLPGSERHVPAFAFDTSDAGWDQGRLDGPGLALEVDGEALFLDTCAQQVLAAFICAYPAHLGGIALTFLGLGVPVPGLDMPGTWLSEIGAWAQGRPEVAEVWLFGSRAKGTARPDSDVDLGIVLVPGEPGHDWPEGNYQALGDRWQAGLAAAVGRHVSLVAFGRPGEPQDDDVAAARASAILLWTRQVATGLGPASLSTR